MQAVVNEHDALSVALVLAIHIAALCLDVIRCYLPPKEPAGSGVKGKIFTDGLFDFRAAFLVAQPSSFSWACLSTGEVCHESHNDIMAHITSGEDGELYCAAPLLAVLYAAALGCH